MTQRRLHLAFYPVIEKGRMAVRAVRADRHHLLRPQPQPVQSGIHHQRIVDVQERRFTARLFARGAETAKYAVDSDAERAQHVGQVRLYQIDHLIHRRQRATRRRDDFVDARIRHQQAQQMRAHQACRAGYQYTMHLVSR